MTKRAATSTYRVLGTTDDVTTCGVCGREELRGTIVLDSGSGTIYAGSDCGAKLAGRPVRDVVRDARTADQTAIRDEAAARRELAAAEDRAFFLWVDETYGVPVRNVSQPADLWDKVPGLTPFQLRKIYRSSQA